MHTTRQTAQPAESFTPAERSHTRRMLGLLLRLVILWPIVWLLLLATPVILAGLVLGDSWGSIHLLWASPCAGGLVWLIWQAVHRAGGRLWEAWIGVVLLGLVANVFISNSIANRGKSRIAGPLHPIEGIRAAIASYAADSVGKTYPSEAEISDYKALVTLVNHNGYRLKTSATAQGFTLRRYTPLDADQDGIYEGYTMSFRVFGLSATAPGSVIFASPGGIEKRTGGPGVGTHLFESNRWLRASPL